MHRHWQARLERARYEATLARRRYEQVDPTNRLVAAELERRWEEQLAAVQAAEQAWAAVQAQTPVPLTAAEQAHIRRLAADLPALWHAPTTTNADRKRLLRCLIQSVTLDSFSQVGFTRIQVLWHTGATSEVSVPRPRPGCRTPPPVLARLRELAATEPDYRIADILNAEGRQTATQHALAQRKRAPDAGQVSHPHRLRPLRRAAWPAAAMASSRPSKLPSSSTSRPV